MAYSYSQRLVWVKDKGYCRAVSYSHTVYNNIWAVMDHIYHCGF